MREEERCQSQLMPKHGPKAPNHDKPRAQIIPVKWQILDTGGATLSQDNVLAILLSPL